ncbi:DUF1588 domain-containing protein [Humisphaera borealis]|uniref:DUF1588 domain-containing protein n=1 Tax=Humisphaera borealis TaxID=2807512 RepID=A0A7M2X581_9BACT|nr:DUF1588 domain-containing protein [Humisphaera borealis]QOV91950.1 DUF1588 domain-containing protein [Humisphaera borealis]
MAAVAQSDKAGTTISLDPYETLIRPFMTAHCVKCHNAEKNKGEVRLDNLSVTGPGGTARWAAVRDQIRDGLMPPPKEPRPDTVTARRVVAWASALVGTEPSRLPNQGNLVPHELLFGSPAKPGEPPAARIWRLSPDAYMNLTNAWFKDAPGVSQPFTLTDDRGIRDYAGLYKTDEASTEILVRNAIAIVEAQTTQQFVVPQRFDKKNNVQPPPQIVANKNAVKDFLAIVDPAAPPTPPQLERAIATQFRMALGRVPTAAETTTYLEFYDRCLKTGDSPSAARTMLQAILLKSDVIFRQELGSSVSERDGRRMLVPMELARAISLTLGEKLDGTLVRAAEKGQLSTREQVEGHVRRMLAEGKSNTSRVPLFFREYFEYHRAPDVFKDKPKDAVYLPAVYVKDTDLLVAYVLQQDKDVFRALLTTPLTYYNARISNDNKERTNRVYIAEKNQPQPDKKTGIRPMHVEEIYGFTGGWSDQQPAPMPDETRIGVLMQPSWLAAWSTNFDNDPVRRGRWVRERLLGGTVPDLPIGVAAQVPDEPHHTFRERLRVTRAEGCWKCHQKMDELGLPFENFDHYGRFRTSESVLDTEATAKNMDKKGEPLGPVLRQAALVTTGTIADSGDPALDGPVRDPRDMLRRIAGSERPRQVFVRHAFRFFMGRNESLADAYVLQQADQAYLSSGGSFKALVTSLLTSDAFLYRAVEAKPAPR